MSAPRLPDFFVIGAGKSGTTSLWHYLSQHPGIFMCRPKEPSFMAYGEQAWPYTRPGADYVTKARLVTTLDAYQALFSAATPAQMAGEASVSSLAVLRSATRIWHYTPNAKLIVILRQPADRAFSHYNMILRNGYEPINDFANALAAEPARISQGWWPGFHYRWQGLYAQHLARYLELFDKRQLCVLLYEDLLADPAGLMKRVYTFLGVDETFAPDTARRYNEGGSRPVHGTLNAWLRNNRLTRALRRHAQPIYQPLKRAANATLTQRPVLAPEFRDELTQSYREEIMRLQELIARDLSQWLAPAARRG